MLCLLSRSYSGCKLTFHRKEVSHVYEPVNGHLMIRIRIAYDSPSLFSKSNHTNDEACEQGPASTVADLET